MKESDPYARTGEFQSDQSVSSDDQDAGPVVAPEQVGRYRIERLLGEGGFGLVYLATDEKLHRSVAIKFPHRRHIANEKAIEFYMSEAQTVAKLDHANIVPVYDVGSTDECPVFFVTKFIEGVDLATRLKQGGVTFGEASKLVATIAEALHYAHKAGIVHRDVKPANTLIDRSGTPHLVDFGLALREAEIGRVARFVGTAAYMSPEQARGEGHRVDGRSDIFSLGIVFYEMLAGRKPFRGDSHTELLEQVKTLDPRPPRQLDDTIPRELERICLKALSKRASERYTTAKDFAADLRQFLADQTVDLSTRDGDTVGFDAMSASTSIAGSLVSTSGRSSSHSTSMPMPSWEKEPLHIVPKGLRSFDEHDADFFLELLPGPCDRDGLPDSLRFWKTRIEETAADQTFPVGLIYGPSGCGKSSLVKAGLLPRLASSVTSVYIEATSDETESRLTTAIRRCCPELPTELGLKDALTGLRQGRFNDGRKVLIVIDQFEQWLHANLEPENTELVEALRQCDGGRVQCIVMVRDDFWMAATRMMRELEIRLVEGHNSAAVDLFQVRHARKVLRAFGRAFGDLMDGTKLSKPQQQFIEQAVEGLAEEGKVVCVRLALFAEMMKGKPWTPTALKEVGGASGVGVAFLEETFGASAAPERRYHEKAARATLQELLPSLGTDIKGHMRGRDQLLLQSGYAHRPGDFDDLLRILDTELKLITPTDPDGSLSRETSIEPVESKQSYYQLTHDYLVPALREWLTRKQKETRAGRAALRLEELSLLWNAKPERRRLPTWWEWAGIATLAKAGQRSEPQQKMMQVATRTHAITAACLFLILAALGFAAFEVTGRNRASALVEKLRAAEIQRVPGIIDDLASRRRWANSALREIAKESAADSQERLHASLALLPIDGEKVDFLKQRMLASEPSTLSVIRDELRRHGHDVKDWLWQQLNDQNADVTTRFRAALALAPLDPSSGEDQRWMALATFLGSQLVDASASQPSQYLPLLESLRPIRNELFDSLLTIFQDSDPVRRKMATGLLVDYTSDQPDRLSELLMASDIEQFTTILPLTAKFKSTAMTQLVREVSKPLETAQTEQAKEQLAKRQANAAAALLHFGQADSAWQLLRHSADPRARSHLIHRAAVLKVDPLLLANRLASEQDVSIRRALLMALGEYDFDEIQQSDRDSLIVRVRKWYSNDSDAGIHSSAEWLLRTWKQEAALASAQKAMPTEVTADRQWLRSKSGHTMLVVDGRAETDIGRRYTISDKEVTLEQFRRFMQRHSVNESNNRPNAAASVITWHKALAYCQWLNQQEGIPADQWCYPLIDLTKTQPLFETKLDRNGYRLPTQAEWEFAARAGAQTSRPYGETPEVLPKYGWFSVNSKMRIHPVGHLKPNDFGAFDMLGNVAEWNADRVHDDRVAISGGTYGSYAKSLMVTKSGGSLPNTKYDSYGFRIARTLK